MVLSMEPRQADLRECGYISAELAHQLKETTFESLSSARSFAEGEEENLHQDAFHLGAHRVMGRCDAGIHTIRNTSAVTKVHSEAWVPAYSGQALLNMCLWETAPCSSRVL